jgi:hypothetical protein
VGLFARLFRLVWGSEVDRALRPVLAVSVAGSTAFAAGWSFFLFGIAALTVVAIAIAVRYLPTRGEYSPEAPLPFVGA